MCYVEYKSSPTKSTLNGAASGVRPKTTTPMTSSSVQLSSPLPRKPYSGFYQGPPWVAGCMGTVTLTPTKRLPAVPYMQTIVASPTGSTVVHQVYSPPKLMGDAGGWPCAVGVPGGMYSKQTYAARHQQPMIGFGNFSAFAPASEYNRMNSVVIEQASFVPTYGGAMDPVESASYDVMTSENDFATTSAADTSTCFEPINNDVMNFPISHWQPVPTKANSKQPEVDEQTTQASEACESPIGRGPIFRKTPGASRPPSRMLTYPISPPSATGAPPSVSFQMPSAASCGGNPRKGGASYSKISHNSSGLNENNTQADSQTRFLAGQGHSRGQQLGKVLSASDLCSDNAVTSGAASDGTCELMVSNLDYNISAREWKKILQSEFQHHIQVQYT